MPVYLRSSENNTVEMNERGRNSKSHVQSFSKKEVLSWSLDYKLVSERNSNHHIH